MANSNFISTLHLDYSPAEKMTNEWYMKMIDQCYYGSASSSLLSDRRGRPKNVEEIDSYADGDFSLEPFKRLFKPSKKGFDDKGELEDLDDIVYQRMPLLTSKLNSAETIISRIPIDISVKASGQLAFRQKTEDINFLRNKPKYQSELDDLAGSLGLDGINMGSTKYGAINYSQAPYGIDLTEPDESYIFKEMIYTNASEAALEIVLNNLMNQKGLDEIRKLLIRDLARYGCSAVRPVRNGISGLPDVEYIHPSEVFCPKSKYRDFRDIPFWYMYDSVTVSGLFEKFGEEIGSLEQLDYIINDNKYGYAKANGYGAIKRDEWDYYNVNLIYFEFVSVDWVGIKPLNKKSRFLRLVTNKEEIDETTHKVWSGNTYCGWWLPGTKSVFGKRRLPYANRTRGQEYLQAFSISMYQSQSKSLVELAIPEVKNAQIAYAKLIHALIKAAPSGKMIDIKYFKKAISSMIAGENDIAYTTQQLIDMMIHENNMIVDTTDFDNAQDPQFLPTRPIPGGLNMAEIEGYLTVIANANNNISRYTGINDQVTGMASNPEGLIGMQRLLVNSSINSISYINDAVEKQMKDVIKVWAEQIREGIKKDKVFRSAIEKMISTERVSLLNSIDDIPLHQMGVTVSIAQRVEESVKIEQSIQMMKQSGILTVIDDMILDTLSNIKEKRGFLAARYKQFIRRQDQIRSEGNAQQQILVKQQGINAQQEQQAKTQGDLQKIAAQTQGSAQLLNVASQLGMTNSQLEAALKSRQQSDRNIGQTQKQIAVLERKKELENETPAI